MPAANVDQALALVKASIARVKHAKEHMLLVHADASSSADAQQQATVTFHYTEAEFRYQWGNVDLILREKGL